MEVAKLQMPRTRAKQGEETAATYPSKTVEQSGDGTVHITKVEIKPKSSGRERFGEGTRNWQKFPLDTPCLQKFSE